MKALRKIIIIIFTGIIGGLNIVCSQNPKLDSLWFLYKKANHDTIRIKLLNEEIGYFYESINPDSAIFYYQKAIGLIDRNISRNISDLKEPKQISYKKYLILKANSLRYIGNINSVKANYSLAIEFYLESNKILKELVQLHPEFIEEKKGISACYNNIGLVYSFMGNYDNAIEYYLKSLKISEELSNSSDKTLVISSFYSMSSCYNNISILYSSQGSYDKALDYNLKSLKINEELENKKGISECLNNIGMIYYLQTNINKKLKTINFEKALECFFKALKIKEELNDKIGLAICNGNIGVIYKEQGNYDKALEFNKKNIKLDEEIGDKYGLAACYINIGTLYITLSDSTSLSENQKLNYLNKAIEYGTKAIELAQEIHAMQRENEAANVLMFAYKKLGNFKKSIEYAEIFIATKDSMFSDEKTKSLAEMGAKYESEKRELTIQKLEKEKELQNETIARKNAESKKQRILIFSFLAGFIIILIFSVFLYRLFIQKRKANVIIARKNQSLEIAFAEINTQKEEIITQRDEIEVQRDKLSDQNHILFEQKKEITDSINYAKRIQEAILPQLSPKFQVPSPKFQAPNSKPQEEESEKASRRESENQHIVSPSHLPIVQLSQTPIVSLSQSPTFETFILFRPKDIVSGDFYWFSKVNDYLIYAVADCTGHGVPGAFMSMLGVSFLNEIVRKKEVTQASHVLDQLRESIIEALSQTGESGTQKDGMDMSLVVIKTQESNSKLQVPSPKFQEPSEEESEKVRQGESEADSVIGEQLADNDTELRSSEMFIEKESDISPVAITNVHQSSQVPCDKDLKYKSQIPNSKFQESEKVKQGESEAESANNQSKIARQEESEQSSIIDSRFATSTSNVKRQTSNFFNAQWAGANNPLWIVRSSSADFPNFKNLENLEEHTIRRIVLQEIKPDKQPVAIYEYMKPFTNHEIQLNTGDIIYLASDGYEDQFGGEKFKKFMSKRLKEMLITISEKELIEQKEILNTTFDNWKGENEQIDDVTILGIRI